MLARTACLLLLAAASNAADLPLSGLQTSKLERLVHDHPDDAGYRLLLGQDYYRWGGEQGPRRAIGCFEKAAESDPGDPYARLFLGAAYLKLDDLDRAKRELEKGFTMRPPCAKFAHARFIAGLLDAHYWLGTAYFWRAYSSDKDFRKAQEQFLRAADVAGGKICGNDEFTQKVLAPFFSDLSSRMFGATCSASSAPGKETCSDMGFHSPLRAFEPTGYRHRDALSRLAFIAQAEMEPLKASAYNARASALGGGFHPTPPLWPRDPQPGFDPRWLEDFWALQLMEQDGRYAHAQRLSERMLKQDLGPYSGFVEMELAYSLANLGRDWTEIRPHVARALAVYSEWSPRYHDPMMSLMSALLNSAAGSSTAQARPYMALVDACGMIGGLNDAHANPQLEGLWNQCEGLLGGAIWALSAPGEKPARLAQAAKLCRSVPGLRAKPDKATRMLQNMCLPLMR